MEHLVPSSTSYGSQPQLLLWEQDIDAPAFSKSFLLTIRQSKPDDPSYRFAVDWLNHAEHLESTVNTNLLSSLKAASGHGIESTSFLLSIYEAAARQLRKLVQYGLPNKAHIAQEEEDRMKEYKRKFGILDRSTVSLTPESLIWGAIQSNSTVYLHVMLLRAGVWPRNNVSSSSAEEPMTPQQAKDILREASRTQSLLMGHVDLIKFDIPHHISKPRRILYHDIFYLVKKIVLPESSLPQPPWVMATTKPKEYEDYQKSLEWKERGVHYPYWKPEVVIKYVNDMDSYPTDYAHTSGMPLVSVRGNPNHPSQMAFMPALHVDEMGLTSEKYIPVNQTITTLPMRISFDRSDVAHPAASWTSVAGGMSPARWRLLTHLSEAIEKQKQLGFEQQDIDDVKRLIADTNVLLLSITMLASALHLLFEFLTFKSDISFWKTNKDLTGLSVRSLFLDMIGQTIILLFLIEEESSLLTTVPSAIGCLIALWKCQRGAGLQFIKVTEDIRREPCAWWNRIPRMFGWELQATRLRARSASKTRNENVNQSAFTRNTAKSTNETARDRLIAMTIESDRIATHYLGAILIPLALGYAIYSLVFHEHRGWYSWLVNSAASTVYALGFVLMTPQLFLNWKLKSVAHLPWRVLVYKSLNTFIDDLFSFIIRMPTMARISCFRDDVVFFVYLYQRWLYPVDRSRPIEGGGEGEEDVTDEGGDIGQRKKNQ
jgi:hypothetical protein